MTPTVLSTNLAHPQADPGGADRVSGIDKRPVDSIEITVPGPAHGDGDGPGAVGDTIGDTAHHGGNDKAVYAFDREELDFWEGELGRELGNGVFGENLTTAGIDLSRLLINQRVRVGTVELEVSLARTPCRTFARWLDERGWIRRFNDRERPGAYFRVITPGTITAGDELTLLDAPSHDVDMLTVFRGAKGGKEAARRIVEAGCLPGKYHRRMVRLLG